MQIEVQSDSSTANSLTDLLEAGQQTKHIDTRYFWIQERVRDGDLSIKKVLAAKNCAYVGTKPVSASVLQQHCKFAGLVFYRPWIPHSTTSGDEPVTALMTELQHRSRQLSTVVVNIETDV